jgi:hypothetical protein
MICAFEKAADGKKARDCREQEPMTARHLYSFLEVVLFRQNPKRSACRKI